MCNCGTRKQNPKTALLRTRMVYCPDCVSPIQGKNGKFYPVHTNPMSVSLETINYWEQQGYRLEYQP